MLNVHASGGRAMLTAARDAIPAGPDAPRLIAVTLLTSMAQSDLDDLGIAGTPDDVVLRLAALTDACGLDGVVCSAREAAAVRAQSGDAFDLVTPGIRPADAAADDQQRVATPGGAIRSGATYLVIGRPITRAPDPLAALERINAEVAAATRAA
jgi:orotidine-5'-phosphate decarboxylase